MTKDYCSYHSYTTNKLSLFYFCTFVPQFVNVDIELKIINLNSRNKFMIVYFIFSESSGDKNGSSALVAILRNSNYCIYFELLQYCCVYQTKTNKDRASTRVFLNARCWF